MATISVSAARQGLPRLLDRVENGEEIEIARHGRVIAVMVSPASLAARRARAVWEKADEIGALLDTARKRPLRSASLAAGRADELVADVQRGRDAR